MVLRFGLFELDVERRTLHRAGRQVRLQEHPLVVLLALTERPGEAVERETLRRRLWPDEQYLDFENGINTAVAKLREALSDTAANPRFVETLPRRGYRFIAPVDPAPPPVSDTPVPLPGSVPSSPPLPSSPATPKRARSSLATPRWWMPAAIALLAAVAIAALVVHRATLRAGRRQSARAVTRFLVDPPAGTHMAGSLALAPDGRALVFVAAGDDSVDRLWLRPLASVDSQPIAGTDGASLPFWSPDSRSIGFFAGGEVKTVELSTGAMTVLSAAPNGRGGAWSASGTILFSPDRDTPLVAISSTGTARRVVTRLAGDPSHRFPCLLPDGRHFLYLALRGARATSEVRWGDLDSNATGTVLRGASSVAYSSGRLLFVRGTVLLAQPFDAERLALRGDPAPVGRGVGLFGESGPTGYAVFSASASGALAYGDLAEPVSRLVWLDRAGDEVGTVGAPSGNVSVALAPDGMHAAVVRVDPETHTSDIWVLDLRQGTASRLTADPEPDAGPVWSRRGDRLAYGSLQGESWRGFVATATSPGRTALPVAAAIDDWLPDGNQVIAERVSSDTAADLWLLPTTAGGAERPLLRGRFDQTQARVSPDGRFLAYVSDESGRSEVMLQPLAGGSAVQASRGGGESPAWRGDGRELFFVADRERMMAVTVSADGAAAPPHELFRTNVFQAHAGNLADVLLTYGVSHDGQRFLVVAPEPEPPLPITVVLDWAAELR